MSLSERIVVRTSSATRFTSASGDSWANAGATQRPSTNAVIAGKRIIVILIVGRSLPKLDRHRAPTAVPAAESLGLTVLRRPVPAEAFRRRPGIVARADRRYV